MSANDHPAAPGRRGLVYFVPLVVFAALSLVFYWGLFQDDKLPSPLIDRQVPKFELPPIEGRQVGLASADLRGQVSIVNVWASWCVPCRVEMPLLIELSRSTAVPIFGINYKDDADHALRFLSDFGDPYEQVGADKSGRVSIDWGVYGLPETFIIDADGRIAHKHVGPFDREVLEEKLLPIVRRLQNESNRGG